MANKKVLRLEERETAEESKKFFLAFEQGLPQFHTVLSLTHHVASPVVLNKYLWSE